MRFSCISSESSTVHHFGSSMMISSIILCAVNISNRLIFLYICGRGYIDVSFPSRRADKPIIRILRLHICNIAVHQSLENYRRENAPWLVFVLARFVCGAAASVSNVSMRIEVSMCSIFPVRVCSHSWCSSTKDNRIAQSLGATWQSCMGNEIIRFILDDWFISKKSPPLIMLIRVASGCCYTITMR